MSEREPTQPITIRWILAAWLGAALLSGCSPEIGSEAWCEKLKETPKLDWSARNASDFAQFCLFQ